MFHGPRPGMPLAAVSEKSGMQRYRTWQEEPFKTAVELAELLDGFPRYPKMHPCGLGAVA
jgi:hypothetical protein